jgi:hypothetical protein
MSLLGWARGSLDLQRSKLGVHRQWLYVALICFLAISSPARAAEATPFACTPEMLDVQVLPPQESNTVNQLHTLIIEIQNRSQSTCQLQGPTVNLLPESGADPFTNSFFSDQEFTPTERQFQQNHSQLAPRETAHVLIVWASRDSLVFPGCVNRDRLSFSPGPATAPLLTIEHLWMHLCDRAYISHYRAGRYVGEPVPAEWLKRLEAQPADFALLPFSAPPHSQAPPLSVETRSDREMLNDYVELFLNLPRQDHDCPFLIVRKREPDGLTRVYINHCKILSAEDRAKLHLQDSPWTTRLNLPAFGLRPEKTGTVEFEVVSSLLENGQPVYARAKTSLVIRDPQFPRLPAIDTPFPDCLAAQLQATRLPTLPGGKRHDAHVYDVTNFSTQPCRLGGVPTINFSHPQGQSSSAIPSPCPNCADPLFQPRPSGWIDLHPQSSAHFIVGASRFPTDSGPWRQICSIVDTIELKLSGENQSLTLPFGVGTCAQVNISAWREGKYDGDPLNLLFAKSETIAHQTELPKQCAAADFTKLGRPVIIEQGKEMAFGLSVLPATILSGEPVPLHLWIDNPTDREASVMTCSTLDFFWAEGFDVYDAYGHRLLKKNELKNLQTPGLPSNQVPNKDCRGGWGCGRNFAIPIPPRTCANGNAYQLPYDFNRNLADYYDLSPGVYYIVPAAPFDQLGCRVTVPWLDPANLRDKLRVTIEQN